MNGLDPIPHLKVAKAPPDSKVGCPVCKTKFAAKDGLSLIENPDCEVPCQPCEEVQPRGRHDKDDYHQPG